MTYTVVTLQSSVNLSKVLTIKLNRILVGYELHSSSYSRVASDFSEAGFRFSRGSRWEEQMTNF